MHSNAGGIHPCRFGCSKKCEPFTGTSLHLHHMDDDMNGARMSGVEGERATRGLLGLTVLTVFLEPECIHRKDARVAGRRGFPSRQYPGDTIAQHALVTEAEVQRMCNHERENVAWPVDQDGAVTLDRESRIPVEPSSSRRCVTTSRTRLLRGRRLDGRYALCERGSRGDGVSA